MAGGAVVEACRKLNERLIRHCRASVAMRGHRSHLARRTLLRDIRQTSRYGTSQRFGTSVRNGYRTVLIPAAWKLPAASSQRLILDNTATARMAWSLRSIAISARYDILDYVIVEDCGRRVNPMIVEGQTIGGAAQGIGTALLEEMPYDANGQPLASTLADYMLPSATEIPRFRLHHIETPSPNTEFGIKGVGEGGAIPPPAAIFNAVNDALRPLKAEVAETPLRRGGYWSQLPKQLRHCKSRRHEAGRF